MRSSTHIIIRATAIIFTTGFIISQIGISQPIKQPMIFTVTAQKESIKQDADIKQPDTESVQESQTIQISTLPKYNISLSLELQQFTYDLCNQYEISYELVLSVMYQESTFITNKVHYNKNGTNDKGLMQLNSSVRDGWAKQYNITNFDPFIPKQNIEIGLRKLKDLIICYEYKRISETKLIYYVLGSYNNGVDGYYDKYISRKKYKTDFANKVLKYKQQLETIGTF